MIDDSRDRPNYYAILTADVRYDERLKPNEKLMYAEITALANFRGYCSASNSYFCKLYKVHKNTVGSWVNRLVELGYIRSELVRNDKKQIIARRLYITNLPINEKIDRGINEIVDRYQQKDCEGINEIVEGNTTRKNTTRKNNNNRSSDADPASRYSEQFENWWSIYPRKIGKGKAYKIWAKDKLDKRVDGLIEKLSQQNAMQFAFTEDKFIPHASTYLSEARYDDEIEQRGSANETNFTSNQQIDRTTARNRKLQEEWDRLQNNEERDGDVIPDLEVHGRQLRPTLDN